MPSVPNPRPLSAIQKLLKQTFVQTSGVNDLATGSSINNFLDAAALSDFRSQGDIIATLNSIDIDRAEGPDLDNLGAAKNVLRPQAQAANGLVTIGSSNFTMISTQVYAGTAAPPAGSLIINISDGSAFPQQGAVYLGRGSNNVEGPLPYWQITQVGTFYQLSLGTSNVTPIPTAKNHNVNESVVLAQGGNRQVNVGTIVQTVPNATSPANTYRVLVAVTIPDGQQSVTGIPIVCTQLGSAGNASANAITSFANPPFAGAFVTNPVQFVTGRDVASDQAYRLLIKNAAQTASLGTPLAITTASVGVTSTDDNQTVTSAQLVQPANRGEPALLYIDNGMAYQPIFSPQGFEQVIYNANGGEKFLQLQNEDLVAAVLVSSFQTPFTLTGGQQLNIKVGGILSSHIFQDIDFATQNAASSTEVVNSINSDTSLLFSARATNGSQNIEVFANSFVNEDLQVVPPANPLTVDANQFLGFDSNLTYTLRLYKNDVLLIKDGLIPTLESENQSLWSAMTSGETLTIKVDQSIYITYTFVDADFIPFGYSTLLQSNSLAAWAGVINNKIAGVTATVNGDQLQLQSNLGANNNAALSINSAGSSLAAKMFGFSSGIETDQGRASDYALNRSTGQIELTDELVAGDVITAGSKNTRGFVNSATISTGSVSLAASTGTTAPPIVWVSLDEPASLVPNTASASSQITITNPSTNVWQLQSSVSGAFADVNVGDWVVLEDDAFWALNHNFTSAFRVSAATSSYIQFYMTNSLGTTGVITLTGACLSFIRTAGSIQELTLPTGSQTLTSIANSINTQLVGGTASTVGGKVLRIATNTYALTGSTIIAGNTSAAQSLGFTVGDFDVSNVTHTAFAQSQNSERTFPAFIFDSVAVGTASVPPTNITTTTNLQTSQRVNPDVWLSFLNPYTNESSNEGLYAMTASINGTSVVLRPNDKMRDIIAGDRYYVALPYDFTASDNLVVIFDDNPINESLNIPLGRNGTVNGATAPTTTQFTAYDTAAGPTANYANQFGNNYSFNDFKIHFAARQLFTPAGSNNRYIIRSAVKGPTGNSIQFGIDYPTAPNAALSSTVTSRLYTDVKVYLSSGPQRLGGAWDTTTQFDVTTTSNTATFTWNGIGTAPRFDLASIAPGDIANIAFASNFADDNTGTFQITAVTATYFTVTDFFGIAQNNVQLTAANNLVFYPLVAANNTATLIATYVNANLENYVTMGQLQSGTGAITTSTFDDQSGTSEYKPLVDGENWVSVSNIGTTISPTNQFTVKVPFGISASDPNYSIVNEPFVLIPVNTAQIVSFLNIFAVTGLSSIGNIIASNQGGAVELYSNLFGSPGQVLVSGGAANGANGAIITSGETVVQDSIAAIGFNGSTVTVTTADKHDVSVGDSVIISGTNNSAFPGTFTVTSTTPHSFSYTQTAPTITIASAPTGAIRSGNVVTITTTTPHGIAANDTVTISGVTVGVNSFNGTFTVVSVPSTTTFTYNQVGANETSGSGSVTNMQSSGGSILSPYTIISINQANAAGFQSGQWLKVSNTATQAKVTGFSQSTQLSITGFNTLNIASGPGTGTFQTQRTTSADATTQMKVEFQGQFVCFSYTGSGSAPNFTGGGVLEGDWVRIGGAFNVVNQGIFKVAKVAGANAFYIENAAALEQLVTMSGNTDLIFYSYDSIMPGDQLILETPVLGVGNQGTYTVALSPFPTATAITVAPNFAANVSATALVTAFTQVIVNEAKPFYAYKRLLNITPDPSNVNGYNLILFGSTLSTKLTVSAGGGVSALSKFNFLTTVQSGEDSYKYYGGLIHAVGEVIRGEPVDPVDFPGVAAAGSYIIPAAPLPYEIMVSVVIRDQTGIVFATIQSRVQSAVAAYVNSLGLGQPVVFSQIVSAVQALNGIQAVSIASPLYNSTDDQIPIAFNQKPVITNPSTGVVVSLQGA